jgi:hypothetical protein
VKEMTPLEEGGSILTAGRGVCSFLGFSGGLDPGISHFHLVFGLSGKTSGQLCGLVSDLVPPRCLRSSGRPLL